MVGVLVSGSGTWRRRLHRATIFSAKDERNGLLSVLWFNLAHYALRPWPWILTALAAVVLYPGLAQPERGYMLVATRNTPHAILGILLAGFMAAFMSTIATQLNWAARIWWRISIAAF